MGNDQISSSRRQAGAAAAYVIKWLVVPIVLAALGFFFVGPKLTKSASTSGGQTQPIQVQEGENKPKHQGEPNVEVTANPIRRAPTRRSSHKRDKPKPDVPEESVPAPDVTIPPDTSNAEEPPRIGGG